jgi:hypothetical protein
MDPYVAALEHTVQVLVELKSGFSVLQDFATPLAQKACYLDLLLLDFSSLYLTCTKWYYG